jgi:hypothetical protein
MNNENEESIDKQQSDANKASNVLSSPFLVRQLKYLSLSNSQKKLYKHLLNNAKSIDTIKKNFNKENIFEVEHFNF